MSKKEESVITKELIDKVQKFIGLPPNAVMFRGIELKFPEHTCDELELVISYLFTNNLVDVWENGWISGKAKKEVKLSSDDIDWLLGTGRFSQG